MNTRTKPCVMVFSGLDPSGGAGVMADIEAIGAVGAHALPVITALTVQRQRSCLCRQSRGCLHTGASGAGADREDSGRRGQEEFGIVGNRGNALAIRDAIMTLRRKQPDLPVVLDTVLGSGHGFSLADGVPEYALSPLIGIATLVTPNLPEARRLYPLSDDIGKQAANLMKQGAANVLVKGGHGDDEHLVFNDWYGADGVKQWRWPRLEGEFHGTGCTLASAIAGYLAQGRSMEEAILHGQIWCQQTLVNAFSIAKGQRIPGRVGMDQGK